MSTLLQRAIHAKNGRWGYAKLPHPHYGPLSWRATVKRVQYEFGSTPEDNYEDIATKENFVLRWIPKTSVCGITVGKLVLVPWFNESLLRFFAFHHERAHLHVQKYLLNANEADVWGTTIEFTISASKLIEDDLAITQDLLSKLFG